MAVDLVILGVVLLFGLLGAVTGAAAQIAQLLGLIAAFFLSRPIARWIGPKVAASLNLPAAFGVILATILVFIVLVIAVRVIATSVLRRALAGRDPTDRSLDRTLGMVLSGAKVAAIAYIALSALAFVEQHVVVAGKRLGVSPKDSHAFALAREHNLFEITAFAPVQDLTEIARSIGRGDTAALEKNAAYRSIRDDARFKKIVADPEMRRAIEAGDYRTLLKNNLVLQMIQDPTIAARLAAATKTAE